MKKYFEKELGIFIAGGILLLAGTMVNAQDVHTDYDHDVDFTQYHRYCIKQVHAADQLTERRLQKAVEGDLNAKGLQKATSGSCDLSITSIGMVNEQKEYSTFYNGMGPGWGWRHNWGWGGGWGSGSAITTVDQIPVGTISVDLYDTAKKELVWRGTSQQDLSDNPEKNIPKLNKAIDKMFKNFPGSAK